MGAAQRARKCQDRSGARAASAQLNKHRRHSTCLKLRIQVDVCFISPNVPVGLQAVSCRMRRNEQWLQNEFSRMKSRRPQTTNAAHAFCSMAANRLSTHDDYAFPTRQRGQRVLAAVVAHERCLPGAGCVDPPA